MRLRWFRIRETTAGLAPDGSWMCRVRSGPDCCLQVCGRSSGEPIVDNLAGRRFGALPIFYKFVRCLSVLNTFAALCVRRTAELPDRFRRPLPKGMRKCGAGASQPVTGNREPEVWNPNGIRNPNLKQRKYNRLLNSVLAAIEGGCCVHSIVRCAAALTCTSYNCKFG